MHVRFDVILTLHRKVREYLRKGLMPSWGTAMTFEKESTGFCEAINQSSKSTSQKLGGCLPKAMTNQWSMATSQRNSGCDIGNGDEMMIALQEITKN